MMGGKHKGAEIKNYYPNETKTNSTKPRPWKTHNLRKEKLERQKKRPEDCDSENEVYVTPLFSPLPD